MSSLYLDHNATTPLHPEAREALFQCLDGGFGNPSSLHREGRRARELIEAARETVAAALGVKVPEIAFTSGGTEADNLALRGVMGSGKEKGRHIVTTAIEHPAVLETCRALENSGCTVTYVQPEGNGVVSVAAIADALRPDTAVVSVMAANNETGCLQPVREIGSLVREKGIVFHTDAVQAFGRVADFKPAEWECDLLSLSAHKVNGPKGVGALYVRKGIPMASQLAGGSQERGLRGGTENVAGIAAFAQAVRVLMREGAEEARRLGALRDKLEAAILSRIEGTVVNGSGAPRLSNTTSIAFEGCRADLLVMALDLRGIAVSAGSACASGSVRHSHVLMAMGRGKEAASSSLRFSLGRGNEEADLTVVVDALAEAVAAAREP